MNKKTKPFKRSTSYYRKRSKLMKEKQQEICTLIHSNERAIPDRVLLNMEHSGNFLRIVYFSCDILCVYGKYIK